MPLRLQEKSAGLIPLKFKVYEYGTKPEEFTTSTSEQPTAISQTNPGSEGPVEPASPLVTDPDGKGPLPATTTTTKTAANENENENNNADSDSNGNIDGNGNGFNVDTVPIGHDNDNGNNNSDDVANFSNNMPTTTKIVEANDNNINNNDANVLPSKTTTAVSNDNIYITEDLLPTTTREDLGNGNINNDSNQPSTNHRPTIDQPSTDI